MKICLDENLLPIDEVGPAIEHVKSQIGLWISHQTASLVVSEMACSDYSHIRCVKLVRATTGWSLRESKDVADAFRAWKALQKLSS